MFAKIALPVALAACYVSSSLATTATYHSFDGVQQAQTQCNVAFRSGRFIAAYARLGNDLSCGDCVEITNLRTQAKVTVNIVDKVVTKATNGRKLRDSNNNDNNNNNNNKANDKTNDKTDDKSKTATPTSNNNAKAKTNDKTADNKSSTQKHEVVDTAGNDFDLSKEAFDALDTDRYGYKTGHLDITYKKTTC